MTRTTFKPSVKSYQRNYNSCTVYYIFYQHNLGSSKWDKVIEESEDMCHEIRLELGKLHTNP